jgi:hypothetical protein
MSTTTSLPARQDTPAASRAPRRGILHGVTWLVWRQHRAPIAAGALLLLAVAAVIAQQHSGMVTFIHAHDLAGCSVSDTSAHCVKAWPWIQQFSGLYETVFNHASDLASQVPLVIGVFFGAPLLARELESGTYRLAWTQSVTRLHWVLVKLSFPMALVALATSGLSLLWDWWWHAGGPLFNAVQWWDNVPFDLIGPAPVGLAVLALTIGTALGLLLRRTVTAMLCTFIVSGFLEFAVSEVRPHLLRTVMAVSKSPIVAPDTRADSWQTQSGFVTGSGSLLPQSTCTFQGEGAPTACFQQHDITGRFVRFHPVSQMWPLSWAEAGICLALAAALATWVVWRVARQPLI